MPTVAEMRAELQALHPLPEELEPPLAGVLLELYPRWDALPPRPESRSTACATGWPTSCVRPPTRWPAGGQPSASWRACWSWTRWFPWSIPCGSNTWPKRPPARW